MVSPRCSRRAYISSAEDWNFPGKVVRNQGYKSKTRGDIFQEKGVSEQFCSEKESNNDPTESNTIDQSNNKSC